MPTYKIGFSPKPCQTPITVATPIKPSAKPINCARFGFSSRPINKIANTVIKGVTALIIPAKIEVTLVSARANKIPGNTFKSNATTNKCPQIFGSFGNSTPFNLAIMIKVSAPNEQRPKATPSGVRNSNPCLIKRNDIPQVIPSKT